jgi:hypothetical protein
MGRRSERRTQRIDKMGQRVLGAYKDARAKAQSFGQGSAFDRVSEGAMAAYKRAASTGKKPRIAETNRDALSRVNQGPGQGGAPKSQPKQDVYDYDGEKVNEPNVTYGSSGGGYLDNMDMVDSVTGNYFAQHEDQQAGYYAPPEDDPNETKFTGAGPSNTQARDASWNNSFINPGTGSYTNDEAARAAFATPYYPTTKQNAKNKVTTPGKLTDEDIQQLNQYQMNLERKQKTKGLTKAEADKLNDYYKREEYYRTRGGYDAEPESEQPYKAALAIDPKTGLTTGVKPPAAKPSSGTMKATGPLTTGPAYTGAAGNKPRPVPSGSTLNAGTGKVTPPKAGTTPKASSTAAGSQTGGKGGTGGSTAKGTNTTLPAKKDDARTAAIKSLHTAQRWPGGPESVQVAATVKKYPAGQIARAAKDPTVKTVASARPVKKVDPTKTTNPPKNTNAAPASPGPKVVGNPTYKPGYGPAKAPAGSSRAAPNTGGAAKSAPAGTRANTGAAAKPVPTGTTKNTNYSGSKGQTYIPGFQVATKGKAATPVYSPRASDPSGKPKGTTGPTRILPQPKVGPADNQVAARAKQTSSGSKAYSAGFAVGNKVPTPAPRVDPSQKKKVTTARK